MSVTAVVVAADDRYLEATLAAVARQTRAVERVIIADASDGGAGIGNAIESLTFPGGVQVDHVASRGARNFGAAVKMALLGSLTEEVTTEWLWLLHDDSPPEPAALAELIRATAGARAVGIAGCKQVDYHDPDELVSVGVRYTRAGRRVAEVDPGEIDQGQYDDREDVYAVGTAGMLIRTRTWRAVGGTDPVLGPFHDGADLCRRVRLSGQRVIVVPTARVRHARASLWYGVGREAVTADGRHSFFPRRLAILHGRLTAAPLWAVVFTALVMLLAAPVRALWRVASNDIALAVDELRAPLTAIGRIGAVVRARRTAARQAKVPRSALAPLQATRQEVRRLWWHRWRQARVEQRRRLAPSELEIRERRILATRRRWTLLAVTAALVGLGALVAPAAFGAGAFTIPSLSGGGLAGVDDSYQVLWQRALSAWRVVGDGGAGPAAPFTFIVALLATLGGAPAGVSSHAFINVLLIAAPALAGLSAWFAAGAVARSVLLRAWAAIVWACVPALAAATQQGRVGVILAHILLPLLGLALARAFGLDQRDVIVPGLADAAGRAEPAESAQVPDPGTIRGPNALSRSSGAGSLGAAGAAGLLLAAIGAASPILLPALGVLLVILIPILRRARLVLIALPTLVLFAPTIAYAARTEWSNLLLSPGPSVPVGLSPRGPEESADWLNQVPWYVLSGWAEQPPHVLAAGIITGALVLAALLGLLRGGQRGWAARWGWLLAGLGVATAAGSAYVLRPAQYDWLGSLQRLPEWSGPGASLAAGGLILAGISGLSGVRRHLSQRGLGWRHAISAITATALVVAMGASAAGAAAMLREEPVWQARTHEPIPALARQLATGPDRSRVLMLAPTDEALVAEVWRSNGPQFIDSALHHPGGPATDQLAELAAELATATATDAADRLAEHAIGVILLPPAGEGQVVVDPVAREELAAALDSVTDLERVTENTSGTLWRVLATTSRAQLDTGTERIALNAGLVGVSTDLPATSGATLILAERADPGWRAWVDGVPLRALDTGWQQQFDLIGGSELEVRYDPAAQRIWRWTLAAVFLFTAVLAIPTRRRGEDLT